MMALLSQLTTKEFVILVNLFTFLVYIVIIRRVMDQNSKKLDIKLEEITNSLTKLETESGLVTYLIHEKIK